MTVKIDRKLNFVSTVIREDGTLLYLHAVPLPYEVVEENCVLLGSMFNNFFSMVGGIGAPRVAAMMLRKALKAQQEREPGAPTIIDDMQRLTTVVWNDDGVWKTTPLDTAFKQGIISPDEYREVEGEVVFFMVASAIQKANLIAATVGQALDAYNGQLTSLTSTGYRDSLPTSKTDTDTQTPIPQQELSHIPS
ncbi:TPA: hypothetical protein ACJ569_003559 [Kluyvera cryocrescens]